MVPGRYADRVLHMKYISTGASALQPQLAIAEFIGNGHYEPHLRRMRAQYQRGRDLMIDWVARYFPEGTRASRPRAVSCSGSNWTRRSTPCAWPRPCATAAYKSRWAASSPLPASTGTACG